MRVLLDECLPLNLRHELRGHEAHTVQWAGINGKKNGDLLQAAENAGYDVFITVDQGLPHQTHSGSRTLAVIVLSSPPTSLRNSGCLSIRC